MFLLYIRGAVGHGDVQEAEEEEVKAIVLNAQVSTNVACGRNSFQENRKDPETQKSRIKCVSCTNVSSGPVCHAKLKLSKNVIYVYVSYYSMSCLTLILILLLIHDDEKV